MRWFGKVCNYHCPCVFFSISSVSPCPAIGNLPIKQGQKGVVLHCPVVLLAFFFVKKKLYYICFWPHKDNFQALYHFLIN